MRAREVESELGCVGEKGEREVLLGCVGEKGEIEALLGCVGEKGEIEALLVERSAKEVARSVRASPMRSLRNWFWRSEMMEVIPSLARSTSQMRSEECVVFSRQPAASCSSCWISGATAF